VIQGAPIGARLEHCTFASFEVSELNREPLEACRRLAGEGRPGVLLMGKSGVGKTHLLVATMKEFDRRLSASEDRGTEMGCPALVKVPPLAELLRAHPEAADDTTEPTLSRDEIGRSSRVEYWPLLDLTSELRSEITRGTLEVSRRCRECDLLVLDDLGAERVTDFVLEELERIVDWRYRTMKPTAVATNLRSTTEISAKYGQRALSRWMASCELFTVLGGDRRASMKPT
jgi:DNA replication protein DnaC